MKKIITATVVVVLIVIGVYVFVNKKGLDKVCEEGFRFVPSTQTCEPVDKPKETTIDFSKVIMQIPDSSVQVQLQKNGDTTKYSGIYQDSKDPSVRVATSLDTKNMIQYSPELVLVPFILETGGTGQFVYIGLFNIASNTHISSSYIGDRITVSSMTVANEKIKVNFKTRLDSESFAVEPSIPAQVVLEVKDNKLVELMKLQNADYSDVEIKSLSLLGENPQVLSLKAAVPGTWYFEAIAQFKIVDSSYNELALGSVQALSDWMTVQRVPFELTVNTASLNYKGDATLIIHSENVQGEEEGERKVKKMYIPFVIK
jgi:hypothetical protein